jgi:hypothetical protein
VRSNTRTHHCPSVYTHVKGQRKDYGHSQPYAPVNVPEIPAEFQTVYRHGQAYMYIQASPVEIKTPTHCNLIGRSMSAPPSVSSPSSILPPPSSHYAFISARKTRRAFQNFIFHFPIFFSQLFETALRHGVTQFSTAKLYRNVYTTVPPTLP